MPEGERDIYGGWSLENFPDDPAEAVRRLVDERVSESHVLSYKQGDFLDKGAPVQICKEFCSFFNSTGGVIIVGVAEDNKDHKSETYGLPVGFMGANRNLTNQWLDDVLVPGIMPRAPLEKIVIRKFPDPDHPDLHCYVVYVPSSESAPHQVSTGQDGRYYKRGGEGRVVMLDYEIRDMMGRRQRPKVTIEVPEYSFDNRVPGRGEGHAVLRFWLRIANSGRAPARSLSVRIRGNGRQILEAPNLRLACLWRHSSGPGRGWYMAWEPNLLLFPGACEDIWLQCHIPMPKAQAEVRYGINVVGEVYAENLDRQPFGFCLSGYYRDGKYLARNRDVELTELSAESLGTCTTGVTERVR